MMRRPAVRKQMSREHLQWPTGRPRGLTHATAGTVVDSDVVSRAKYS